VVTHPLKTRIIADAKIKTDKHDARTLADLLRGDLLPTSYVPPKELRHLVLWAPNRAGTTSKQIQDPDKDRIELRRKNIKYRDGTRCFMEQGKADLRRLNNPVIDSYLAIYEVVEKEIKKADRAIGEAGARHEEVKLLTSIMGVCVYSALIIFSDI
jgi:transposase